MLPILSIFPFFPWEGQLPVSVRLTTVPGPAEASIKTFFPSWVSCCDAASHAKMFPHCPMMNLLLLVWVIYGFLESSCKLCILF